MSTTNKNKKFFNTSRQVKKALGDFEALTHLEAQLQKPTKSFDKKTLLTIKKLISDLSK